MPERSQTCPCGEVFDTSSLRQIYCTPACKDVNYNMRRRQTPAIEAPKPPPRDGLRCRACGAYIETGEGWRVECRACSRERLIATCKEPVQIATDDM